MTAEMTFRIAVVCCLLVGLPSAPAGEKDAAKPKIDLENITVFVAKAGEKYHCPWCRHVRENKKPIKLKAAEKKGYTPCMDCQPLGGGWLSLTDGKSMKGWERVEKAFFNGGGPVKFKNGNIVMYEGLELTGMKWTGTFPKMNYEVLIDAKRVDGFDFFCGTTFPVGDSYCSMIPGGWGDTLVGLSCIDDMLASDNETARPIGFKNKKWYRFRIKVTKPKIEVWIDEKQVIDFKTKGRKLSVYNQEPLFPFGIATWCTTGAVRRIRIRPADQ